MHKDKWVVGKDYSAAPTCATCHMGATSSQAATHDVGTRISWTLRPPVSVKLENADKRREDMKDVCSSCHAAPFVEGFYRQFDNLVVFYNEKFGKPATAIRKELIAKGKLTPADFDDKLDWIYYELWHHEGRRARHGASMSGPELYAEIVKKYLEPDIRHEWYLKGMSKEQLEKIKKYSEERYGNGGAAK